MKRFAEEAGQWQAGYRNTLLENKAGSHLDLSLSAAAAILRALAPDYAAAGVNRPGEN